MKIETEDDRHSVILRNLNIFNWHGEKFIRARARRAQWRGGEAGCFLTQTVAGYDRICTKLHP
jgi:hypothetical protein